MATLTPDAGIPYVAAEWPHGMRCTRCNHLFRDGESFTTALYAFADETPLTEVVCLACVLRVEDGSGERDGLDEVR